MSQLSWSECTPDQRDAYRQAYLAAMHIEALAEAKYTTLEANALGSGSPLAANYTAQKDDATNTMALMAADYNEWLNDSYGVTPPDDPTIARIQAAATALGAITAEDQNATAIADAITAGMDLFAGLVVPLKAFPRQKCPSLKIACCVLMKKPQAFILRRHGVVHLKRF